MNKEFGHVHVQSTRSRHGSVEPVQLSQPHHHRGGRGKETWERVLI